MHPKPLIYHKEVWKFVLEVMEPFSKGIHQALVSLESCIDRGSILELHRPGYQMLTQTDIVRFLTLHSNKLKPFISSSVGQAGAIQSDKELFLLKGGNH